MNDEQRQAAYKDTQQRAALHNAQLQAKQDANRVMTNPLKGMVVVLHEGQMAELSAKAERYEFLRTLAPVYYAELWNRCIKEDLRFDDEVDRLIEERRNNR